MAFGSVAGMRKYVNKTFDLESKLGAFTDGRTAPTVPLAPLLSTWFWGLARRLPSTEQIGDLLRDGRWRALMGLRREHGGSPDTAARVLDELAVAEWHEFQLEFFFQARRMGLLTDDGPYGQRCAIIDLNELFTSRKRHCDHCQQREVTVATSDGQTEKVTEFFHQAAALVWAGGEVAWPIGWELLQPGEGELTAACRLLARLLPRLRHSLDVVMGDALYCCRPFFMTVCGAGLEGLAVCSGQTDLDEEMDFVMTHRRPHSACAGDVEQWELESPAWEPQLKLGRPLRVLHGVRRYAAKAWKHERRELRIVSSAPVALLPAGQGWKVGRCRWKIENGTFNVLTRDYRLTHNYRHSPAAILGLLVLRSVAFCVTWAYRRFAAARARDAPRTFLAWFTAVLGEDWVRYLDGATAPANPRPG